MLHHLPLFPINQLPHTLDAVPQDYPLQLIPGGDRAQVPFRVSELKEIKKDLGNYTENPDQYIQACREVSQNFELSWKDVMLFAISDPHFSGEIMGSRSGSHSWRQLSLR
jgi:hypothetical protein